MRSFSIRVSRLWAFAAIAACFALVVAAGGAPAPAPGPNFVIVLADDLGYGDLGCYGNRVIKTPNLDAFAAGGLRLTDCYAAAPVCSPSRTGLLTGRFPYRAGIYDWIPAGSPMHLRREEGTLPKLLKQAGYETAHVGKWHCNGLFNDPAQPQPGDHGFDYWFSTQNNAGPSHRNPVNFVRNGQRVGPLTGYSSVLIVDEALRWLESRRGDRPFCLFVWFHSPHEIVATDEKYVAMYPGAEKPEQAIYYGNVTQLDAEFGRLMAALDRLKVRDRTLVMFTSDNGPAYAGAHAFGSAGPLRGKKLYMYEGGIREPGLVQWPGHTRPGQVSHDPVCNVDLLPTFCRIAGVTPPKERPLDGVSIVPLMEGKDLPRRPPLYWQYDRATGGPTFALRDGDWKLLAYPGLEKFELYNLRDDVAESKDLAAAQPDRLRSLTGTMKRIHDSVMADAPRWPPGPGVP